MPKILVVDDEEDFVTPIAAFLAMEQHEVDVASSGEEALAKLKTTDFDLIILDWMLPVISGPDVCKRYRENGGTGAVLLITAKRRTEDKEIGLDAGADDYLTKPFDFKELGARVRALLRRLVAAQKRSGQFSAISDLTEQSNSGRHPGLADSTQSMQRLPVVSARQAQSAAHKHALNNTSSADHLSLIKDRIFISYSSFNRDVAYALCSALENQSLKCWIAPRDIPPGKRWPGEIIRGIRQSVAVVFIYSEHTNDSDDIARELEEAKSLHVPIIRFVLDNSEMSDDIRYLVKITQWFDATEGDLKVKYNELAEYLHSMLAVTNLSNPLGTGAFRRSESGNIQSAARRPTVTGSFPAITPQDGFPIFARCETTMPYPGSEQHQDVRVAAAVSPVAIDEHSSEQRERAARNSDQITLMLKDGARCVRSYRKTELEICSPINSVRVARNVPFLINAQCVVTEVQCYAYLINQTLTLIPVDQFVEQFEEEITRARRNVEKVWRRLREPTSAGLSILNNRLTHFLELDHDCPLEINGEIALYRCGSVVYEREGILCAVSKEEFENLLQSVD
ncbi:MAG TPA: response regulator [Planktothrix sp.]|jgi:CheY-like chemotaxis protein